MVALQSAKAAEVPAEVQHSVSDFFLEKRAAARL